MHAKLSLPELILLIEPDKSSAHRCTQGAIAMLIERGDLRVSRTTAGLPRVVLRATPVPPPPLAAVLDVMHTALPHSCGRDLGRERIEPLATKPTVRVEQRVEQLLKDLATKVPPASGLFIRAWQACRPKPHAGAKPSGCRPQSPWKRP